MLHAPELAAVGTPARERRRCLRVSRDTNEVAATPALTQLLRSAPVPPCPPVPGLITFHLRCSVCRSSTPRARPRQATPAVSLKESSISVSWFPATIAPCRIVVPGAPGANVHGAGAAWPVRRFLRRAACGRGAGFLEPHQARERVGRRQLRAASRGESVEPPDGAACASTAMPAVRWL
jgi:hypothetical protein